MSDEEQGTKGGHAPAEKIAGGVRIARKERVTSSGDSGSGAEKVASDDESFELEKKSHNEIHAKDYMKQIKKDFPTEGIKAFHEKPQPTKEPPHQNVSKQQNSHLFQPSRH